MDEITAHEKAWGVYIGLRQTQHWVDADGHWWKIEDLGKLHLFNIIRYCEARASILEFYYSFAEYWGVGNNDDYDNSWMDAVLGALDDDMEVRMKNPLAWLNTTPLMKKLKRVYEEWESDGHFADVASL